MHAFQKELSLFEKQDAQVLGVSSDTLATHRDFASEKQISFPLVADEKGTVQKLYGSGRATFVIDKSGVVRHIQRGFPDTAKLLAQLARLQKEGDVTQL